MMVRSAVAVALAAAALIGSGCFGPSVYGTGPVKGCGTDQAPAVAVLGGHQVAWVGTAFVAHEDGVVLWIEGAEADLRDWWGGESLIDGWAVLAVNPNASVPEVVDGSAGVKTHGETYTTVQVGGQGQTAGDGGRVHPMDHYQFVDPITLKQGDTLHLFAASTEVVMSIALNVFWKGCGETKATVGGLDGGGSIAWGDLDAPVAAANALVGVGVAYEARGSATTDEAVVYARAPPGATTGYGGASLKTSRGEAELSSQPSLHAHDGGAIEYATTYLGGDGAVDGPLVVWFELPLSDLHGPITERSGFRTPDAR